MSNWMSKAWGLTLIDGPLPIGDVIYWGGCILFVFVTFDNVFDSAPKQRTTSNNIQQSKTKIPDYVPSKNRPKDKNGRPVVEPGDIPGPDENYVPPKTGPHQGKTKDGKKGWVDKSENIWVPVPTNTPLAHGGGHWDVNRPDGKGYINVYPGGSIRPGSGKVPIFPQ